MVGAPFVASKAKKNIIQLERKPGITGLFSANDQINIAIIGAGGMGQGLVGRALEVNGVKLVAACDLYESRLIRCNERWGEDVDTTMEYEEILSREDVDAVIVATSDHWHDKIAIDAMHAGKAVYLEKPVTQHVEEAYEVIEAEQDTNVPLIVGSQRSSNIIYEKARELYLNGEIGELNFVEGYWDRLSATGAWQYSIPPGASPENVHWEKFRKDLPEIPFDAKHFFRWRNYQDYGTGVSGDLFVHLFSGMHMILDSPGPNRIMATGGLRYWHDGRDVADLMLGLFDYAETGTHPEFNLSLRVNFADGSGGGSRIRMIGSEGEMDIEWNRMVLRKARMSEVPGMTIGDFSEETRREYEEYHQETYPRQRDRVIEPREFEYLAPEGYHDQYDHFVNFFKAIREDQPILQDASYGLRAAGPALLANKSQQEERIIQWDPEAMKVV